MWVSQSVIQISMPSSGERVGDLLNRPLVADDDDDDAAPAPRAAAGTTGTPLVGAEGSVVKLLPALDDWRECEEAADVVDAITPAIRVGVIFDV